MLWTQILYLTIVSISLLQDQNINEVPLPCDLDEWPISLGGCAQGGLPSAPGARLSSSSALSGQVLYSVTAHKLLHPKVLQIQFPARWRVQPSSCRWSKLLHRSSGVAVGQMSRERTGRSHNMFPQLQQGILAQHTPPFSTPAQRVLFIGARCLLFGLEHCLVTHPLWDTLYSTAEPVQVPAASLVSSQESWPEPHYTRCFHAPLSQGSPLPRPVLQPRQSPCPIMNSFLHVLGSLSSQHACWTVAHGFSKGAIFWWQVPQKLILHLQQCFAGTNNHRKKLENVTQKM